MSDVVELVDAKAQPGQATRHYLRFVALLFLALGLFRAAGLMGLSPDGEHFLALSPAWRTALVTLCVLNLLTAVGLWVGAAWGPVIWAVAAVAEVAMYTVFRDVYGSAPSQVLLHLGFFGLYLAFLFADWRRWRREE
ncbi:DUF6163 family protein [Afifella pfennigii]|uniref:DUF6163 family protein n=1 Tax=Afifella pfennigii TaxID=209897 RepID=UPI00068D5868|nr:DUF6163 family protein [Afifella pfennigii]